MSSLQLGDDKYVSKSIKLMTLMFTIFFILLLNYVNTLRTGDADLHFYVTTVQDG